MANTPSASSSVSQRRLRTILRRERDAAQLTQDQVAHAMDWSLSKVIRIESGIVNISINDLRAMLDLYGVSDVDKRTELLELARSARRPPWWAEYRDTVSSAYIYYIGLESNSAEIRYFHNNLIPGLIQTEAYARAVIINASPEPLSKEVVELRVELRMRRQAEFFDQPKPPTLIVVLDETAIRRGTRDSKVMRAQLDHLMELAQRETVTLRIIPFEYGIHAGPSGPYIIMEFSDPDTTPVLYLEGTFNDEIVREKVDSVELARKSFDRLLTSALSAVDSLEFIRRVAEGLS